MAQTIIHYPNKDFFSANYELKVVEVKTIYFCIEKTTCGFRAINPRLRIVGGKRSKKGRWPWQIGLYGNSKEGTQFLGVIFLILMHQAKSYKNKQIS